MIQIHNLKKVFKTKDQSFEALKGVDLHIEQGEIYGVIGLSGAGKSTLIRTLNRLEEPTSGKIVIDGTDMCQLSPKELRDERRRIGMIFQHFNLMKSRTVAGNIAFPLEIAGWSKADIQSRVQEMLALVGLEDKADVYPSQLSGGQKQRVAIARALANRPKVLLCDEATSALDPKTTQSILNLLKSINAEYGLTIILITHQMEVIRDICDKVAIIEHGHIIEEGSTVDVFSRPKTQTAKDFIAHLEVERPCIAS